MADHQICKNCLECIDCGLCKCGKGTLEFKHIEHAIRNAGEQSRLWLAIKNEVKRRGHWKNLPKGKARFK